MRKGMDGLAVVAQQALREDPFDGTLFAFRGTDDGASIDVAGRTWGRA
jgi:hypothetical protein